MNNRPSHEDFKKKALADEETLQLYNDLEEEFSLLKEFIQARQRAHKTQAEVAKCMGTKTSAVGRLESSLIKKKHSPSLSTLRKYARAIGCRLEIHLVKEAAFGG